MTGLELLSNGAFPRALVIGSFGGVGLALTAIYSRRGPLIYPVYAALLAALALLLARFSELPYLDRSIAVLGGFVVASLFLYGTAGVLADRQRRSLVEAGRLPASALRSRVSLGGHAWRLGSVLAIGAIVSAGVAFVAG